MAAKAKPVTKDDKPKFEATWDTLHEDHLSPDKRTTIEARLAKWTSKDKSGRTFKLYKENRWKDPAQETYCSIPGDLATLKWLRGALDKMIEAST